MVRSLARSGITVLLCISLSSCSTTHDPAMNKARQDVFKTRTTYIQGGATGALLGAAAGAGLGAAIGAGSNKAAVGALVGAAAGALVGLAGGLLYAHHVVNQRRAYANADAYLDACTRIAAEQHGSIARYNQTLHEQLDSIMADRDALHGEIEGANRVLKRLKDEIALQKQALKNAQSENVSSDQITAHKAQLEALEHDEDNLTADLERLTAHEQHKL